MLVKVITIYLICKILDCTLVYYVAADIGSLLK